MADDTHQLETDRLILRRFTPADVDHIFALDNDPEVMRYLNGGAPTPRDVVESRLLPNLISLDASEAWLGFFAVCHRANVAFLGWVCLRLTLGDPRVAELGYRFLPSAWGHGYATEAAHALVDLAFATNAVDRVVAETYQDNLASQRVMQRLGMTLHRRYRPTEADLSVSDTTHRPDPTPWPGDDVEYALTRETWQARRTIARQLNDT